MYLICNKYICKYNYVTGNYSQATPDRGKPKARHLELKERAKLLLEQARKDAGLDTEKSTDTSPKNEAQESTTDDTDSKETIKKDEVGIYS